MVATVTIAGAVGLTLVSAADDGTGGTWTGGSGAFDSQVKYQGTASWFYQTNKNARTNATFAPTASVDMSATDTHLYWWMKCDVMTFTEPKLLGTTAPSGLTVRVESSATDFVEWHVAGSDTWGGEWKCFALDLNNASADAVTGDIYVSGGTLSLAAVTKITWFMDNSNSGTIRVVDNTNIDVVRFGTGLTAYGSDFDYADIEAIDQSDTNKYGIIQKIDGVYFVQGKIRIDDNGATTTFNSTDETLAFRDINCSAGLYTLDYTGSGNTVVLNGISVLSSGANDNTRYVFDGSGTVGSFTMSGSSLNRGGLVNFKAGQSITSTKFNNCYQVDPSTSTFTGNALVNYIGTEGGALLWGGGTTTNDCSFTNCDEGIEITQVVDQTFQSLIFDDAAGNFDVHLNNGGTSINVAKTGTPASNPNSQTSTGGGTITFTASYDHILTNLELNTEITYTKVSDGSVLFNIEDATTSDGNGKYKTTYTHGGIDTVNVLVHHISYQPDVSNIYNLVLPASDTTVKVQMFLDRNYENP